MEAFRVFEVLVAAVMEENYWTQQATEREESVIDREFRAIMDHALRPDDPGSDSI